MKIKQCTECHQWNLKDNDNFCGYCGNLIIDIIVEPREIILTSSIINNKTISFKNIGYKNLNISLQSANLLPEFIIFEKVENILIKKQSITDIKVNLDEDRIPKDFYKDKYKFNWIINNDIRRKFELKIKVNTGPPKPYFTNNSLNYNIIDKNQDDEQVVELANLGSIRLNLEKIQVEECRHLKVKKEIKNGGILIKKGAIEKIPIIWDSKLFRKLSPNIQDMKLCFIFKNYRKIKLPVKAIIKKIELKTDYEGNKVIIEKAFYRRKYYKTISIKNIGNTDCEIKEIKSNANWVKILNNPKELTILSNESKNPHPEYHKRSYDLKIEIDTNEINIDNQEDKEIETTIDIIGQEYKIEVKIVVFVIPQIELEEYIGIDFGTTNSVIAIYNSEIGKIQLVEIDSPSGKNKFLIPSVLVFNNEDLNKYKIGYEALSEADYNPELTVRSIKRVMGHEHNRVFNGKKFSPNELAACIIKKLIELAEEEYFKISI